jgi:hypothetical protein
MAQKLESEAHHPNTDDEPENRLLYPYLFMAGFIDSCNVGRQAKGHS